MVRMKKEQGGSAVLKVRREVGATRDEAAPHAYQSPPTTRAGTERGTEGQGLVTDANIEEFWQKHFGGDCPYASPGDTLNVEHMIPKQVAAQRRAMARLMEAKRREPKVKAGEEAFPPGYAYKPRDVHGRGRVQGRGGPQSARPRSAAPLGSRGRTAGSCSTDEAACSKQRRRARALEEAQAVMEIQAALVRVASVDGALSSTAGAGASAMGMDWGFRGEAMGSPVVAPHSSPTPHGTGAGVGASTSLSTNGDTDSLIVALMQHHANDAGEGPAGAGTPGTAVPGSVLGSVLTSPIRLDAPSSSSSGAGAGVAVGMGVGVASFPYPTSSSLLSSIQERSTYQVPYLRSCQHKCDLVRMPRWILISSHKH